MKQRIQLIKALTSGLLVYVLLTVCEPILNFPLRQFSSQFSYIFLQLFISDISLNGTILSSNGINFDVVPACSGSSTLKYILCFGTILCVMAKNLSSKNFFSYFLSLVAMALSFNSLRISTLIVLGIINNSPVEGALHSLVGLIWFTISMISIHFFVKLNNSEVNDSEIRRNHIFKETVFGVLYFLVFLPFFIETFKVWVDSPLDNFSWLFLIIGLGLLFLTIHRIETSESKIPVGTMAFVGVQVVIISALFFDFNALWLLAFMMLIASYLIQLRGIAKFHLFLPSLVVIACAFPASTYIIATYSPLGSFFQNNPFFVKLIISLLMAFTYLILPLEINKPVSNFELLGRIKHSYVILTFYVIASLMLPTDSTKLTIKFPSYVIGPWVGEKQSVPSYMVNFFENGKVVCRSYKSGDNAVQLMVSVHNNERHSMHSPEYCLKGAGWKIIQSETLNYNDVTSIKVISAQKGSSKKFYAYWFAQNGEFYTDIVHVLKQDVKLRLRGQPRNWVLTRIRGSDKQQLMSFVNHLIDETSATQVTQYDGNIEIERIKNES